MAPSRWSILLVDFSDSSHRMLRKTNKRTSRAWQPRGLSKFHRGFRLNPSPLVASAKTFAEEIHSTLMPCEYNIKGTVTFEEYLECHKILAAKRRLWIRGIITVYGIGMLTYGILFSPSKPDFTFAITGVILIAYGFVISPIQFRYRVKRNWDRYPKIKKKFDMIISAEGVETMDDRGSPSHSAWDSFIRFRESESLFLLYLSPLLPLCLPKRLVSAADLSGLRDLLSSAIGNQTNGEQDVDLNT